MGTDAYNAQKDRSRRRQAQISEAGRDLGQLPPPADPERRERCKRNVRLFCETYLPHWFSLAWSPDHLRVIGIIEATVLDGGKYAYAMPRGSGKTTMVQAAVIHASVYGHRKFSVMLGVSKDAAIELLDLIKFELQTNPLLIADFPEVCLPIVALEDKGNKCKGQHIGGVKTRSKWGKDEIVLPTVDGSAASGVIIRARGLLGRIRGMKGNPPDDDDVDAKTEPPRPDLVAVDDPQTDETAASEKQIKKRLKAITSTVLGLAGPGKTISAFVPCTIIEKEDVAHQLLDRKKNPEWRGCVMKLLYGMPENLDLWQSYWDMRIEDLEADAGLVRSNKFYADNREEMDRGATAAWPERFVVGNELSAVQHAMNLYLGDPVKFAAEYQNEPLDEADASEQLTADQIKARINRVPKGVIPDEAARVTAFIDVHDELLFWVVMAWSNTFDGWLVDYGTYPEQTRPRNFTLRKARPKLSDKHGKVGLEAKLYAGLEVLTTDLLTREWKRQNGELLRVEVCMVDAHWGESTATVKKFCKQSPFAAILLPSFGIFVGASSPPMSKRKRKPGDRVGPEWVIPASDRHVSFDANHWKSFFTARLSVPMGGAGGVTLFGDNGERHDLLASHLTAEYSIPVEGRGRKCNEFKLRPGRDNHWGDGAVGCAVGASTLGVALPESQTTKKKRVVVSFAEQQRQARARREGRPT